MRINDDSCFAARLTLLALISLFLPCSPVSAAESIPDIKTLADLRKLPAVHTPDGWDVQVGMADPGDEAGPYRLIYCLADRKDAATEGTHNTAVNLGPLFVEIVKSPKETEKAASVWKLSSRLPLLYCRAIAVGWQDDQTVRVTSDKAVIYERNLGKLEHRPCYWSTLVSKPSGLSKEGDFVVSRKPMLQCPQFSGFTNLLSTPANNKRQPPTPPEDAPLPGAPDLAVGWRGFYFPTVTAHDLLNVSLKDDQFAIDSNGISLDGPFQHLLARWWVNDKPAVVEPVKQERTASFNKDRDHSGLITIRFGVPEFLGSLKAGDRVGLQLLYAPELQTIPNAKKWEDQIAQLERSSSEAVCVPLLSNRLDFTINEHMLALITKQARLSD